MSNRYDAELFEGLAKSLLGKSWHPSEPQEDEGMMLINLNETGLTILERNPDLQVTMARADLARLCAKYFDVGYKVGRFIEALEQDKKHEPATN